MMSQQNNYDEMIDTLESIADDVEETEDDRDTEIDEEEDLDSDVITTEEDTVSLETEFEEEDQEEQEEQEQQEVEGDEVEEDALANSAIVSLNEFADTIQQLIPEADSVEDVKATLLEAADALKYEIEEESS